MKYVGGMSTRDPREPSDLGGANAVAVAVLVLEFEDGSPDMLGDAGY